MKKSRWTILALLTLAVLLIGYGRLGTAMILILFLIGGWFLWRGLGLGKAKRTEQELPDVSRQMADHYEETGMTDREVTMFRETMFEAKNQIDHLQRNMSASAKLKAIDLHHDTLRASKTLFKALVKEPEKLHLAGHFLYTHLPTLVELSDNYLEINDHEIKTKETYEKLEESIQIIDQLAGLIAQDYLQFVADDFDDIEVGLSVAKESLKRDNRGNTEDLPHV